MRWGSLFALCVFGTTCSGLPSAGQTTHPQVRQRLLHRVGRRLHVGSLAPVQAAGQVPEDVGGIVALRWGTVWPRLPKRSVAAQQREQGTSPVQIG